jgi:hypothetical protein
MVAVDYSKKNANSPVLEVDLLPLVDKYLLAERW